MSVTVREAGQQDAAALAAVQIAALLAGADEREDADTGEIPSVPQEVARWRALLGGAGAGWTLVAEHDGDVAGLITTAPVASGSAAVTLVCVLPERHRQGVGLTLLQAALAGLRKRGLAEATVRVARTDQAALGLVAAVGFEPAEAADAGPVPDAVPDSDDVGFRIGL